MQKEKRKQKLKNDEERVLNYWEVVRRFSLQSVVLLLVWGFGYLGYALMNDIAWRSIDDRMLFTMVCSILITGNFLYLAIHLVRNGVISKGASYKYIIPIVGVSIAVMGAMLWMVGLTVGVGMDWWN